MKRNFLIFILILMSIVTLAQVRDTVPAGKYRIITVGTRDYIKKNDFEVRVTSPTGVLIADTVFYVPSTAPNDTITTLMNARPSKKKAAILLQRGSNERKLTITVPKDSIILATYGSGSNPVISGFTTVTGWTNYGGGIYSKAISPESKPNVLMIDGVQYGYGRTPNEGSYYTYESFSTTVSITDNQLASSPDFDGAEVYIYKNEFKTDRCLITSHSGTTITYTRLVGGGTNYSGTNGEKYFIQNDIDCLDAFGEWAYLSGTLYVYFGATNPTTVTTKVSTIDHLIENTTNDYITIKNMTFEGSNSSSIYSSSTSSNYITVNNCTFNNSGGDGVTLNGSNATVTYNTFSNIAGNNENTTYYRGGTICIEGQNSNVSNNTINDNAMIEGIALNSLYMIPITIGNDNYSALYNTIDSTAYMGIYATNEATSGTIQYNRINASCQLLPDAGSIYMGHVHDGSLIKNNIVLNSGGNGIYIDEYAQGIRVEDNVVYNSEADGIKVHKGSRDTITGNLLYANEVGLNFTMWVNEDTLKNNYWAENIIVADTLHDVTELINRYQSGNDIGTGENNYYFGGADSSLFITNIYGSTPDDYLSDWKSVLGTDDGSNYEFKVYGDNVKFNYNNTKSPINIYQADSATDYLGNIYVDTTFTIQPFTGKVLFENFDIAEPDYLYGNFMQESFENTGSPGYDASGWVEVIGANTGNAVDENNTGTPPTGGGSQILRTSSNTTPTADATNSRAYTTFNSTGSINAVQSMYVDGWVYIEAHGLSTLTAAACVHLLDSTAAANPCIQLNVYNEAGTLKWYVSTYTNGATSNYTSSVTLTTGTWYHVKLKYDIANMTYGAWIGDTELISGSLTGTVRVNIDRIRLGVNATRELDVRYDLFNADTGTFSD